MLEALRGGEQSSEGSSGPGAIPTTDGRANMLFESALPHFLYTCPCSGPCSQHDSTFPGFRASALCHASNWSMNTTLQGMCRPCGNPQTPQGLRKGPDTTWLQVRDPTEAQRSMRGRGRVSCTQNSHHTLPGRYPRLPPMPQCSAWHRGPQIPTYSTRALQTHLEDPTQGARQ